MTDATPEGDATPEEVFIGAALRRALDHAPDHAVAPDWRIRKAIRQRAHDALAPSPVEPGLGRPWWKRAVWRSGRETGDGRRTQKAVFATGLVAVLVVVFWQREPVSGVQRDGEAQVTVSAPATAPVAAPPKRETPSSPAPAAPARPQAPVSPPAVAPAARVASGPVPAPAPRAPVSSNVRTEVTDPPTFAALSQWTHLTIAQRGGGTRSVARAEVRELVPLLGSAAISAVEAKRFPRQAEWHLTLERNGKALAVMELAHNQVRWREGKTPWATGTPPTGAMAAVQQALVQAVAPAAPQPLALPPEATPLPPPANAPVQDSPEPAR